MDKLSCISNSFDSQKYPDDYWPEILPSLDSPSLNDCSISSVHDELRCLGVEWGRPLTLKAELTALLKSSTTFYPILGNLKGCLYSFIYALLQKDC